MFGDLYGDLPRYSRRTIDDNDVPGLGNHSDFRAWGNVLRVSKDTDYGQLRFGLWTDYNAGSAYKYAIDLSSLAETFSPYDLIAKRLFLLI